jgi:hypothetical protein
MAAFLAANGRFVADDYCNAGRVLSSGVAGASVDLFQTWHGGWTADFVISVFGWLVLHLPSSIGYAPFVLSTFVLVLLAARAAVVTLRPDRSPERTLWSRDVPVMTTLLLFSLAALAEEQELIFGAFLWQAASLIHFWPTLLTLVLLSAIFEVRKRPGWWVTCGLIAGAVVVAGFNFTETAILAAGSAMLALGFLVAHRSVQRSPETSRTAWRYAGVALVGLVGFVVMYEAPGTAIRRGVLAVPPSSLLTKGGRLVELAGDLTAASLGRPGVLASAGLGVAVAFTARSSSQRSALAGRAAVVVLLSAAIGIGGVALAAAGEVASYPAPWHALALIPWWVIAALTAGVCVGTSLAAGLDQSRSTLLGRWSTTAAPVMTVVVYLLLGGLLAGWAGTVTARADAWDRGAPASPIANVPDREEEWVNTCWSRIVRWGYDGGGS